MLGLEWSGPEFPELTWGQWLFWFVTLTFISAALSALAIWWVMRDLPSDYFCSETAHSRRRTLVEWITSNIAGLGVLLIGVILLFSPGQGILLILCGLIMLDIPGKHRWERKVAARPKVLAGLNWFRRKVNREPFLPPSDELTVAPKQRSVLKPDSSDNERPAS